VRSTRRPNSQIDDPPKPRRTRYVVRSTQTIRR
jgi:hypothetical protein